MFRYQNSPWIDTFIEKDVKHIYEKTLLGFVSKDGASKTRLSSSSSLTGYFGEYQIFKDAPTWIINWFMVGSQFSMVKHPFLVVHESNNQTILTYRSHYISMISLLSMVKPLMMLVLIRKVILSGCFTILNKTRFHHEFPLKLVSLETSMFEILMICTHPSWNFQDTFT